ncbi:D-alanyl-D-alanine carboxypeptidase [Candidatus Saccharibacteria bacterium]|nr:D-alanyl-D-alanine carboxypeptidase [Candidatus Saccharibacteria bacterium]
MMAIAVITALVLQLTGWWPHLSIASQTKLATAVTPPGQVIALPVSPSAPIPAASPTPLSLDSASSVYAIDVASGQVLYAQNADKPRPIASVTKLMTVMVALGSLKPTQMVTVGDLPKYDVVDETMGLMPGEQLSVMSLLKAALIPSDNDAADALALATSGTLPKFYAAMNARAAQWGIKNAHFTSASGLNDTGNDVSAAAVAKIASLDLTNPLFRQLINTQGTTVTDTAGRTLTMTASNDLLATGRFYGIKTGYTEAAGECFAGLTKINGHEVITVVLGSSDRFGETQSLVNWIGQTWTWL